MLRFRPAVEWFLGCGQKLEQMIMMHVAGTVQFANMTFLIFVWTNMHRTRQTICAADRAIKWLWIKNVPVQWFAIAVAFGSFCLRFVFPNGMLLNVLSGDHLGGEEIIDTLARDESILITNGAWEAMYWVWSDLRKYVRRRHSCEFTNSYVYARSCTPLEDSAQIIRIEHK